MANHRTSDTHSRGIITSLVSAMVGTLALAWVLSGTVAYAEGTTFKIGVAAGYGVDSLRWNIAGRGGVPNVLSELVFEDIESSVGRLDLQVAGQSWSLDGEVTYGLIINGRHRDDDFFLNNRQLIFSRSEGSIDDHDLQGAALMIGYAFAKTQRTIIRLLVGGRVYRQRLRLTDGTQIIPPLGNFANLNSIYTSTWYGLAFGVSLDSRLGKTNFGLHIDATGMPLWYDGEGRWNLRSDFQQNPSFVHDATGWGLHTMAKLSYFLGPAELYVGGRYLYFTASDGNDTTFFSDGTEITIPLNEVVTESMLGFAGIGFNW